MLAGLPRLQTTPEADALVERLLRSDIIPVKAAADAVHLALSAAHRMDYLLTWNCQRPPALPVLPHRLSRSARLQTHPQLEARTAHRGRLRGVRFHLPDHLHAR